MKKKTKGFHPRSLHNEQYNFDLLSKSCPELEAFLCLGEHSYRSIDFSDPLAVVALNKALLIHFYGIVNWTLKKGNLCPPVPGRADYLHYVADLLAKSNNGKVPRGPDVTGLDIGVGANCIYPIIGSSFYAWKFIGTEVDKKSFVHAKQIVDSNPSLRKQVTLRKQNDPTKILTNILSDDERVDFSMCNPPFHSSAEQASEAAQRKLSNLNIDSKELNFGGKSSELWCPGGEVSFIKLLIKQSAQKPKNCLWYTTLVSKKDHLSAIYAHLKNVAASKVETIEMKQGNKITRIVAWSFCNKDEHKSWFKKQG